MQKINEDIKTGKFNQIYLLYGEEAYLRKQYRDKLKEALSPEGDTMNTHYFEGKDVNVAQIIDLAETMPFLAEKRVIVMENSGLFKSGGDSFSEYVKDICETAYFIIVEAEIDKRSKLYKGIANQGAVVEFPAQDENTLMRWILSMIKKEGKQISQKTLSHLLNKTGTDMANIKMELEKVFCYCMDKEEISMTDIDAVCVTRISNHIFDMVNAIADNKQSVALNLYYDLLALKEPPMRILFLIARQCNLLLQVKELKKKNLGNKEIGEKIGLPGFIAGKYVTQASRFQSLVLRRAVEKCVDAEEAVKTGKMNDIMSVEILIMSVFVP